MFDPMPERWLPVVGWEGFYEVSDWGRVRSLPRVAGPRPRYFPGRMRKTPRGADGYPRVTLSAQGTKSGPLLVHRLVMRAFVGPCPEGQEVRHLDGDSSNCSLENLTYGTHSENERDAVRHGTHYWAAKTHCPKGHAYDEGNTYILKDGRRACRRCWRVSQKQIHYNTAKTHCPHGHAYTPENTNVWNGKRSCKSCARERAHEKRHLAAQSR